MPWFRRNTRNDVVVDLAGEVPADAVFEPVELLLDLGFEGLSAQLANVDRHSRRIYRVFRLNTSGQVGNIYNPSGFVDPGRNGRPEPARMAGTPTPGGEAPPSSPPQADDFLAGTRTSWPKAELAENGPVRGTMVIRPYGYAIWERMQAEVDARIKACGAQNAYFPLFIPESYLPAGGRARRGLQPRARGRHGGRGQGARGAGRRPAHERDRHRRVHGQVDAELPRPPLLLNQWANVVRWELRPRRCTEDVLVVQINPVLRASTPQTSQEIVNRVNEITFNASLITEYRAIEFVRRLIDEGALKHGTGPGEYRRINVHRVDLGFVGKKLTPQSRLNTDFDFFETLHRAGRRAGRRFLDRHFDDIGVRSTIDLRDEMRAEGGEAPPAGVDRLAR